LLQTSACDDGKAQGYPVAHGTDRPIIAIVFTDLRLSSYLEQPSPREQLLLRCFLPHHD